MCTTKFFTQTEYVEYFVVEKGEQGKEELQLTSATVVELVEQQLSKKSDKLRD